MIVVADLGAVDVYGESTSTAGPCIAGMHSHTTMAGRDAAGTQSCIKCRDIAGVPSYTGMVGRVVAGRHSATGTADPGVHAVIGIEGASTGLARVGVGCVAACWVCTDCTGIARVTAGCVAACWVCTNCRGIDKAGTV